MAFVPIAVAFADVPKEEQPRLDLFGDPLPPGAVARLRTMRLRYAACMAFVVLAWGCSVEGGLEELVAFLA